MSSEPEPHPLDPHPLDREEESGDAAFEFSQPALNGSAEAPPRLLLRGSLYVIIASTAVALIAGVVASGSAPSSTAESVGSAVYKIAAYFMLGGFTGLLFAYRYRATMRFLRRFESSRAPQLGRSGKNPMVILAFVNSGIFVVGLIAIYLIGLVFTESGPLTALAFISLNASLAFTMAIMQRGVLKAYGIGFVVTLVTAFFFLGLLSMSGISLLFNFLGRPWDILLRIEMFHVFLMVSGLVCAGYYFLTGSQSNNGVRNIPATEEESVVEG